MFEPTEYNRFIMRKNEEFSIVDAVLNYAIKQAQEKVKQDEKNCCTERKL